MKIWNERAVPKGGSGAHPGWGTLKRLLRKYNNNLFWFFLAGFGGTGGKRVRNSRSFPAHQTRQSLQQTSNTSNTNKQAKQTKQNKPHA
jgi:hypothetical protein